MSSEFINLFVTSFVETLLMGGNSGVVAAIFGIPLGVTLNITDANGIVPHPLFNRVLGLDTACRLPSTAH